MSSQNATITARSGMITAQLKTGRAGALTPGLPALTPETARATGMSTPRRTGWWAGDLTPDDVAPLLRNFITKFQPGAPDECWAWNGTRMPNGYGVIGRSYRAALLAHRVAYVAFTGESLTGDITIDHLCNTPLCVNPDHLEPVTLAENIRRKNERRGYLAGGGARTALVSCGDCGRELRRDTLLRHRKRMHV